MGFKGGGAKAKRGAPWIPRSRCAAAWILALMASASLYALTDRGSNPCSSAPPGKNGRSHDEHWSGDLRTLEGAWNRLCLGRIPAENLRVAVFSKKWPVGGVPGGMERHAYTLHRTLAQRGHRIHVYTVPSDGSARGTAAEGGLRVHFVQNEAGRLSCSRAWQMAARENATAAFDVVHSESVALPHWRAKGLSNAAATWHGIGYEAMHSEVVQDLARKPGEARSPDASRSMAERVAKLVDEIRFFPSYRHHVSVSDHAGAVLRGVYQLPRENVHVILNGVDDAQFAPDARRGAEFRDRAGVPRNATVVMGVAGRLVKDKGHPLLYQAFARLIGEDAGFAGVYLLVAGSGPWGERYRELAPRVKVVGALEPSELLGFYNALDVFVNPTLRPQGLDLTMIEAMHCAKPLLATDFPSITGSVIVGQDLGYTFSPRVESVVRGLRSVVSDGARELRRKGRACREYASLMFTATKMAQSYERLFLCMKNESYCRYPLPTDCPPPR